MIVLKGAAKSNDNLCVYTALHGPQLQCAENLCREDESDEILSIVVDEKLGSGGLFDAIDVGDSGEHVGKQLGAVEQPPMLLRRLHEFKDHCQAGGA